MLEGKHIPGSTQTIIRGLESGRVFAVGSKTGFIPQFRNYLSRQEWDYTTMV